MTTIRSLPPGKTSFLNVGYRTSIAARVASKEEESLPIERLSEEKARAARERLEAIAALTVPEAIRGLLEAGAYAEHGLYADAIAAYRRVLTLRPEETIRVTLGDLYLQVGLHRFAFARYQEALDRSDDPAVDAAATFGIGRLYAARRNDGEAFRHFRKAERLYEQLGLDEEKAAAKQAAAAAETRPERAQRRRSKRAAPKANTSAPARPALRSPAPAGDRFPCRARR